MSEGEKDGVIQFQAIHRNWENQEHISFFEKYHKEVKKLQEIRQAMRAQDWIGQDIHRYQNTGFGNLSMRVDEGFLITPSQTSDLPSLCDDQYTLVYQNDIEQNQVYSIGFLLPSSEAMTHAMLYRLSPQIKYILHGHVPKLWYQSELVCTDAHIGYGTIAMAQEVARLWENQEIQAYQIFRMGGHLDGVLLFGHDHDRLIQMVLGL